MSGPPPMPFFWDGEAFRPKLPKLADRHFVVGETYPLEVREDRSGISHRHYFACIAEAFQNLPEHLAKRFASPEQLRRYALIKAGYRDERSIVCASKAEASRVAAFIKPMDEYAVVFASGNVVTVFTAKSQSMRAMDKATFQASKDRVLEVIAGLIGTDARTLEQSEAA